LSDTCILLSFSTHGSAGYLLAVTVISMLPGPTSRATSTVVLVGRGSLK
jgi:hypothetical protein